MSKKTEVATAKFDQGFNCAQSVLYSFCDDLHFDADTALKMASGLGAGMGRNEEVCGAVTGGIIVIGAKYGMSEMGDIDAKELTYTKTQELMQRFAEKNGSFICRRLLREADLKTDEGQKFYKENDLHQVCLRCIQSSVEILEDIT
ncbi:MAG: C_GCAxxG_C_C family protein [Anaerolineaceae bacterium]|nr:C_GCAxxG_C_C family protein [Anaerolineaceae bacterium]